MITTLIEQSRIDRREQSETLLKASKNRELFVPRA
jgi:hypothetical protein